MKLKKLMACVLLAAMTLALLPTGLLSATAAETTTIPFGSSSVELTLISDLTNFTQTQGTYDGAYGVIKQDTDPEKIRLETGGVGQFDAYDIIPTGFPYNANVATVKNLVFSVTNTQGGDIRVGFQPRPSGGGNVCYYSASVPGSQVWLIGKNGEASVAATTYAGRWMFTIPKGFDGYIAIPTASLVASVDESDSTSFFLDAISLSTLGFHIEGTNAGATPLLIDDVFFCGELPAYSPVMAYGDKTVSLTLVEDYTSITQNVAGCYEDWGPAIPENGSLKFTNTVGITWVDVPSSDMLKQSAVKTATNFVFSITNKTTDTIRFSFEPNQSAIIADKTLIESNPAYLVDKNGIRKNPAIDENSNRPGFAIPAGFDGYLVIPSAAYANIKDMDLSKTFRYFAWGGNAYSDFYLNDMYICDALPTYEIPKTIVTIPVGNATMDLTLIDDFTQTNVTGTNSAPHGMLTTANGVVTMGFPAGTLNIYGNNFSPATTDFSGGKYFVLSVNNTSTGTRELGFAVFCGTNEYEISPTLATNSPSYLIQKDGTCSAVANYFVANQNNATKPFWQATTGVEIPAGFNGYLAMPANVFVPAALTPGTETPFADSITGVTQFRLNAYAGTGGADDKSMTIDDLFICGALPPSDGNYITTATDLPATSGTSYGASINLTYTAKYTTAYESKITYQWYKDNTPISGATASTFAIPATWDAGQYSLTCRATCASQTITSATCTLTIDPIALDASHFAVQLPADLSYTGEGHTVTVTPAAGITGMGTITVIYKTGTADATQTPPSALGDYDILVNVTEGTNYNAVEGLKVGSFTITACTHAACGSLVPKVDPTCQNPGMEAHYFCTTCQQYLDASKNVVNESDLSIPIDPDAHTFNKEVVHSDYLKTEASCKGHAVYYKSCACGAKGTDTFTDTAAALPDHRYGSLISETAATCQATGTKEHYTCSVCSKHFDASKQELTDLTIPVDPDAHTIQTVVAKDPTCTEEGWNAHEYCTNEGCTYSTKVTTSALQHIYGALIAQTPATCHSDGMEAHYVCQRCGVFFDADKNTTTEGDLVIPATDAHEYDLNAWGYKDASGHAHVCQNCDAHDTVVPHTSAGAATEQAPEICRDCGYIMAPQLNHTSHTPSGEWSFNTTHHWKECTGCGEANKSAENTHDWTNDCDTECNTCGYQRTITHTYGALIPEVSATCQSTGTVAHYVCSVCNKTFNTANEEITDLTLPIDPNAHKLESVREQAPTCTEIGWEAYQACSHDGCDHTVGYQEIPALKHTFDGQNPIARVNPTCQKEGMETHYYCERCETYFTADGTLTATTKTALTLAVDPTAHVYDHEADTTCNICGATREVEPGPGPSETDPSETDPSETDPSETDPSETDPSETDPSEADPPETDPTDPEGTDPIETAPSEPVESTPNETDRPSGDATGDIGDEFLVEAPAPKETGCQSMIAGGMTLFLMSLLLAVACISKRKEINE